MAEDDEDGNEDYDAHENLNDQKLVKSQQSDLSPEFDSPPVIKTPTHESSDSPKTRCGRSARKDEHASMSMKDGSRPHQETSESVTRTLTPKPYAEVPISTDPFLSK